MALIGLQWVKGKALLVNTSAAPYVGVRSDKTTEIGQILRDDGAFQEKRKERKDAYSQWWAAFRYRLPQAPFPEQHDEYRVLLLDSIQEAWEAYAPAVDRAVSKLTDHA
jgi:hypothetical protein